MNSKVLLIAAALMLGGCVSANVTNDIPDCARVVPPSLTAPVEGTDIPAAETWPDGHEKAEPWQLGYLEQTGNLDKANEKAPAVDHIYKTCLELHRERLKKDTSFFGRLFG